LDKRIVENQATKKPFVASDLYVGANLNIFGHKIVLKEADEFTLKFMEENEEQFPLCNVEMIQKKLQKLIRKGKEDPRNIVRETKRHFKKFDNDRNNIISVNEFRRGLLSLDPNFTEQVE
jgi:hypothetical protein